MKKSVFLFLALCTVWGSLRAQSGHTTVSRFKGKAISGIDVSGAWNIRLSQGQSSGVELIFPERFKEQLILTLQNGKVRIGFRGSIRTRRQDKLEAVIVCSSLDKIQLSGACNLNGTGAFHGKKVEFDLSGAVNVDFEGEINAADFSADLFGAAVCSVGNMKVKTFEADLSGAAVLEMAGEAETGKIDASGAVKFDMGGFSMKKAEVDLSGASIGRLHVTEVVNGDISGTARLTCSGGAETRIDVSGAGSLKQK